MTRRPIPSRAVGASLLTAWATGSLVLALELPRRDAVWAGMPLVLGLGALVGALGRLLQSAVPPRHAGLLLLLPVAWAHAALAWSVTRAADRTGVQSAFVLACALLSAGAVGVGVARLVGGSARWRVFFGVAAALAVGAPLAELWLRVVARWPVVLPVGVAVGVVLAWRAAFARDPRLARGVALLAFGAAAVVSFRLPVDYPRLAAMCAWFAVYALTLAGPERVPPPERVGATLWLVLLAGVGASSAHAWVMSQPAALRDARTSGGPLSAVASELRTLSDFDGDGSGAWLGQVDCAPFDAAVSAQQHERRANGRDDNCRGGDARGDVRDFLRDHVPRHPAPPPFAGDVIMVLVDTLRFDHTVGDGLPDAWERLRERGTFYTQAHSTSSFTTHVLATLLGGRFATSVPFHFVGPFSAGPREPLGGLPVWLSASGYATAVAASFTHAAVEVYAPEAYGAGIERVVLNSIHDTDSAVVMGNARRLWSSMGTDRPRFLLVHSLTVHAGGSLDPVAYRRSTNESLAAVAALYDDIGRDALFVVVADHGEEFGEHGDINHAKTLFEEVMHVPLLIVRPDQPGAEVRALSSLTQLVPTLLAAVRPDLVEDGTGPFLCLPPAHCVDAPVPMALERPGAHLHGLRLGSQVVLRDIDEDVLVSFDMARDPRQLHPRPPDDALLRALVAWEEAFFVEAPAEAFWPYMAPRPTLPD